MKKYTLFLLFPILFTVIACDMKISLPIKVSELLSTENASVFSTLKFSTGFSCDEKEIRKIEKSLKELKINAQYTNRCEKDNNQAFAFFLAPLEIVKNDNIPQLKNVFWLNFKNGEISIQTSNNLPSSSKTSDQELKLTDFEILLTNDTQDDIYIKPYIVFINSEGIFNKIKKISPYETVSIRLSDVANKVISNPSTKYTVFVLNKDFDELKEMETHNLTFY